MNEFMMHLRWLAEQRRLKDLNEKEPYLFAEEGNDRCIDGVPAPHEAALTAFYRGEPICPFCGRHYRELEAEHVGFGEIVVVTCLRCDCGVFPVKAEVLKD